MKKLFIFAFIMLIHAGTFAQTEKTTAVIPVKKQIVEASCGECKFGIEGHGCVLAVRIDGKPYLVTGNAKKLDEYGDAHGTHGMCNEIRKAEVEGEIKDGKFVASTFTLLPLKN